MFQVEPTALSFSFLFRTHILDGNSAAAPSRPLMKSSGGVIGPSSITLQGGDFPGQHLTPEAEKDDFGRNGSDGLQLHSAQGETC